MRDAIKRELKDVDIKYIDPSYIIRSIPTTSNDRIYCKILAHNAVHAAFAGERGLLILAVSVLMMAFRFGLCFFLSLTTNHNNHTTKTTTETQKTKTKKGYTGITVGLVNTHYVYLPIPIIIQAPRRVDPRGKMWNRLRASIGQPNFV